MVAKLGTFAWRKKGGIAAKKLAGLVVVTIGSFVRLKSKEEQVHSTVCFELI